MPGWLTLPVVNVLPLLDATITNAPILNDGNAIEIEGTATGGTGLIYILRRTYFSTTSFRYKIFAGDRGIDLSDAGVAGQFWDRLLINSPLRSESFALYNPGGWTFATPPRIRAVGGY